MKRFASAAVAVLLLLAPAAPAGQERLTGNWLIEFFDNGDLLSFWMLKIDDKGKGTLDLVPDFPESKLQDLKITGDALSFVILFRGEPVQLAFKLKKEETKKFFGTLTYQGQAFPVQLLASKLESLKKHNPQGKLDFPKGTFNELRDKIVKNKDDLGVFEVAEALIVEGQKDKVTATDMRAALAPALEAARQYGESWEQEVNIVLARALAMREPYAAMAEEMLRFTLKTMKADSSAEKQMRILALLATSLAKQNKKDERAKVEEQIEALEVRGHHENEKAGLGFTPDVFKGRKGDRVVLVELFTGASCPPCVAADLAFEGLGKTYKKSEVVLLQYHLHIPRPDPLTNPDTVARSDYYGDKIEGTPTIFFNGKPDNGGGGSRGAAGALYKEYRKTIDPLLEGNSKIKLTVSASRAFDSVVAHATVTGIDKPGDKLRLRFALVETWVRYPGSNGLSYHYHVVRAMLGGAKGLPVKVGQEEKVMVDLDTLRKTASKHLDNYAVLEGIRPFSYRELRVVAFVQDDATQEVLQAVEVAVK